MWTYPARFQDKHGEETTTIQSDGKSLRMVVRGIAFVGHSFDTLDPECGPQAARLAFFELDQDWLSDCVIESRMEIQVMDGGQCKVAELCCSIEIGSEKPGLGGVEVRVELLHDGISYFSSGRSGWFENELLEIQRQLPVGAYMKTCINCAYSDYSPSGHQVFGDMMCFRNKKEQYLNVKGKTDFWALGKPEEDVQETYVCPEFERRKPGTGYRG